MTDTNATTPPANPTPKKSGFGSWIFISLLWVWLIFTTPWGIYVFLAGAGAILVAVIAIWISKKMANSLDVGK
jgi:hypothetical protein